MQRHIGQWSIEEMAKALGVSRSGYYQFSKSSPCKRSQENKHLITVIRSIHQRSRGTYGSPRIHAELQMEGELCSRKRVARLMKQEGIEAKMKRRFRTTTKVDVLAKKSPNLLQQDFRAEKPNQRWVSDNTYIATDEGWLYVAAILDLFSRRIVGLSMGSRLTTELVRNALYQAITHRKPESGLLYHSDKGCQYTSHAFQKDLAVNEMLCSMSGTGNCYDNAAMESFFHTLKTEHVYFESYKTREQAKQSIFEYVEVFYNRKRRHSTLGFLAPEIFENQWLQRQNLSLPSVH